MPLSVFPCTTFFYAHIVNCLQFQVVRFVERSVTLNVCTQPSFTFKKKKGGGEKAALFSSVLRKEKYGSHMPTHSLPVIPPTCTDSSLSLCFLDVFSFVNHVFPSFYSSFSFSNLNCLTG